MAALPLPLGCGGDLYLFQDIGSDVLHLPPPGEGEGRGEGDPQEQWRAFLSAADGGTSFLPTQMGGRGMLPSVRRSDKIKRFPLTLPSPSPGGGKTRISCETSGSYWGELHTPAPTDVTHLHRIRLTERFIALKINQFSIDSNAPLY